MYNNCKGEACEIYDDVRDLEPFRAVTRFNTRAHSLTQQTRAEQNGATAQMDKVVYDSKGKLTRPDTHIAHFVV